MSEYPPDYASSPSFSTSFDLTSPFNLTGFSPYCSQADHAKLTYLKFLERIFDFENELADEYEIGARLTSYSSDVIFYIQEVSYSNPHMIFFSGCAENGDKLQLVQHVSQLSVLLVALEKRGEEPIRIAPKLKYSAEKER